jgi:hypothetical protein
MRLTEDDLYTVVEANFIQALWLSGYSDRLEIYFLREQEFESLRRRHLFARVMLPVCTAVSFGSERIIIDFGVWRGMADFGREKMAWRRALPRSKLALASRLLLSRSMIRDIFFGSIW